MYVQTYQVGTTPVQVAPPNQARTEVGLKLIVTSGATVFVATNSADATAAKNGTFTNNVLPGNTLPAGTSVAAGPYIVPIQHFREGGQVWLVSPSGTQTVEVQGA